MRHITRTPTLLITAIVLFAAVVPMANSFEFSQQIVQDEITVGNTTVKHQGDKRVSPEDLIRNHHFKLEKGAWSVSYKPDKTTSVPLVWCRLRYAGKETNESNRTYKKFRGTYSDLLNELSVELLVFDDGNATLYVGDYKEGTNVIYFLDISYYRSFMKAVYDNN